MKRGRVALFLVFWCTVSATTSHFRMELRSNCEAGAGDGQLFMKNEESKLSMNKDHVQDVWAYNAAITQSSKAKKPLQVPVTFHMLSNSADNVSRQTHNHVDHVCTSKQPSPHRIRVGAAANTSATDISPEYRSLLLKFHDPQLAGNLVYPRRHATAWRATKHRHIQRVAGRRAFKRRRQALCEC
jgi:hypothetical protein